jgi:hypothetical protein
MDQPPVQVQVSQAPTNNVALWSMILGIMGLLCLGPITGIPAIICGHKARKSLRLNPGKETGDGMALSGLILGYVSTVLGLIVLIAIFAFGMFTVKASEKFMELDPVQIEMPSRLDIPAQD